MAAAIRISQEQGGTTKKGGGGGGKPVSKGVAAEGTTKSKGGVNQTTKGLYKKGGSSSVVHLYPPGDVHPHHSAEPGMTCMLCGNPSHRAQTCEQAINEHQPSAPESEVCSILPSGEPGGWPSVVTAFNALQKATPAGQENLLCTKRK